jgi:hypothetical protein
MLGIYLSEIFNYDVVQFLPWKKAHQARERILIKYPKKMTRKERQGEL